MEALVLHLESCLKLMKEFKGEDNYRIRLSFYQQAYGAVSYEEMKAITGEPNEAETAKKLWAEWEPILDRELWGE